MSFPYLWAKKKQFLSLILFIDILSNKYSIKFFVKNYKEYPWKVCSEFRGSCGLKLLKNVLGISVLHLFQKSLLPTAKTHQKGKQDRTGGSH